MLGWLSPRGGSGGGSFDRTASVDSAGADDNYAMCELMIGEVEAAVYEFECDEENRRTREAQETRVPDYSWLISPTSARKPKKFLTMPERAQLTRACELVRTAEWSPLSTMWKARRARPVCSREHVIDIFISCINDIVGMRPRPQTVGSILTRYLRSQSSVNSVGDTPRLSTSAGEFSSDHINQPVSARSLGPISFRSLDDVV